MVNLIEYSDFANNLEKKVKITGKVAEAIWQHMTTIVNTHNNMEYFDLKDNQQIVVYSKDSISRNGRVELTGKIIKVEGKSKNPGSKIHDDFYEFQMIVDSWKRI